MSIRISTGFSYSQFLSGLQTNQYALTKSQAQISSGLRLLRPSDDPSATSRVIGLRGRLSNTNAYGKAATDGRSRVDFSASVLQDSSELLTEIRTLVIQSMNGSLNDDDRKSLGAEISFLREQMLELGNSRISGRYVFGGSATGGAPFTESSVGGVKHVNYAGNSGLQEVPVGEGVEIPINVPGSDLFSKNEATGTSFSGLTGLSSGTTADMGLGIEYIDVRHDSTVAPGLAGLGIGLVNGGSDDEIIGAHSLVIDPVAGTITLGGGQPVVIPDVTDPGAADLVVKGPSGGELHLDMSGYAGATGSTTVTGTGSLSIDGSTYTTIDPTETDLELRNESTGSVVHIDMSGIDRAGEELVHFSGAVNLFDSLQGIVDALENKGGLTGTEVTERLNMGLDELDRNQANILGGIGVLGSRSVRLSNTVGRLEGQSLNLNGMISELRDVDFSEAVLDLTKAEQRLQLVQMSGTRMIKNSLLNFIR
jgi:flagellar hook-associated protein 3 FlgL